MDLVEFQGKALFHRNGVAVPPTGAVCRSVEEIVAAATTALENGAGAVVVKAQVKTGGRGKAGGVKLASTLEDAREHVCYFLGLDFYCHIVIVVFIVTESVFVEVY